MVTQLPVKDVQVRIIQALKSLSTLSWIILGDFNEVLCYEEVSKSLNGRLELINDSRRMVDDFAMFDVSFSGYKFTYSNKGKGNDEFRASLDRVLMDSQSKVLFLNATVDLCMRTLQTICISCWISFLSSLQVIGIFKFEVM